MPKLPKLLAEEITRRLKAAGEFLARTVRRKLDDPAPRLGGRRRLAARPGDAPFRRSGRLRDSVELREVTGPEGLPAVRVLADTRGLETGIPGVLRPHPFLQPVFAANRDTLARVLATGRSPTVGQLGRPRKAPPRLGSRRRARPRFPST